MAGNLFAGTRLMAGNGLEDDREEEEAAEDEIFEDDDMLEDSADFRHSGFGLTGLSVRW